MRKPNTLAALSLLAATLGGISPVCRAQPDPVMFAHYIDVGQGDCTLLEFPCGAVLIDAGVGREASTTTLIEYLDGFFNRRTDLDRTFEVVFITHNHDDHNHALERILKRYNVERYVENGKFQPRGAGAKRAAAIRTEIRNGTITTERLAIDDDDVVAAGMNGLTNNFIDPIECAQCDPDIRILSGRIPSNPGWARDDFRNHNNHSLVIRVDFDQSTFLFTGDLEEPAIETMVEWYGQTDVLDIDVYQVGHHGSANGTTHNLIQAMTPELAVFSVGHPEDGSTKTFGHPRKVVVDMLSRAIGATRSQPIDVKVAIRQFNFRDQEVKKRIYATAWDGTVKVRATLGGSFIVSRNN